MRKSLLGRYKTGHSSYVGQFLFDLLLLFHFLVLETLCASPKEAILSHIWPKSSNPKLLQTTSYMHFTRLYQWKTLLKVMKDCGGLSEFGERLAK